MMGKNIRLKDLSNDLSKDEIKWFVYKWGCLLMVVGGIFVSFVLAFYLGIVGLVVWVAAKAAMFAMGA